MGPLVITLLIIGCPSCVERGSGGNKAIAISDGDTHVMLSELQAAVDRMPEPVRARYWQFPDERQSFLRKMVDNEIISIEAKRLGYAQRPEVVEAQKRAMIVALLKDRIGQLPAISEADIQKYYDDHRSDFGKRSFFEARSGIPRLIGDHERERRINAFVNELRTNHHIEVASDRIEQVTFEPRSGAVSFAVPPVTAATVTSSDRGGLAR